MTFDFLKTLYSDLVTIASDIVVKRMDLARENETVDTASDFELYYACLTGSRYFYNFKRFDADILEKYVSPDIVSDCYYYPNHIPEQFRAQIVEEQAQRVIETYVENNEYYRMLYGLPRKTDYRWIYVTDYDDIPHDVPIHQLDDRQLARLEIRGKIDELKEERPDAEYLDFLGIHRIDFVTARLAKPFEILRTGIPSNERALEMFENEYYGARRYVMATIYNRALFTTKTLYDPVIGIMILCLAIRNTLVPNEVDYLNFEEILDAILESYGMLRYFQKFPYTYKRRLVLAMDKILMIKGTDGVLLDICQLFQGTNFSANRYYLMKTHAKDIDGNVIFTGDPHQDYDLHFVKTSIRDREIDYEEENVLDYNSVVNNDYLWQLNERELTSLLNENFNMWMSKYIGVEAAYDLSELTFEICYFNNLLLQTKDNTMKLYVTNKYAIGGKSTLYTMIVFMLATMAKRSGFDGNIIYELEHIAEILRFDYGDIEKELSEIINKYENQIDVNDTLVPGYVPVRLDEPMGIVSSQYKMVEVYVNNRNLYDAILAEMHSTNDIRKYIALSNAKDCMYISAMEERDFTKTNGDHANTYYEMLEDLDPMLANKLDSYDREEHSNELDRLLLYILEQLEDYFATEELKYLYLNTPNIYVTLVSKYLRTAINVFKASTVQLESINILFNAGDHDPIRVIDDLEVHVDLNIDDTIYVEDEVALHKTVVIDEYVRMIDKAYTNEGG